MKKTELLGLIKEVIQEVTQGELQQKLIDYRNPHKLVRLETDNEGFITMTFADESGRLTKLNIEAVDVNVLNMTIANT